MTFLINGDMTWIQVCQPLVLNYLTHGFHSRVNFYSELKKKNTSYNCFYINTLQIRGVPFCIILQIVIHCFVLSCCSSSKITFWLTNFSQKFVSCDAVVSRIPLACSPKLYQVSDPSGHYVITFDATFFLSQVLSLLMKPKFSNFQNFHIYLYVGVYLCI